jgi:hypothetical protein
MAKTMLLITDKFYAYKQHHTQYTIGPIQKLTKQLLVRSSIYCLIE